MITNKDIRVENGFLIINGDKYPLDGQSPEAIIAIIEAACDTTPTENSDAPITSGGVYTALGAKQDELTFDTVPTENSTNPVESGGVYSAIGTVNGKIDSTAGGRILRYVKTIANNETVEILLSNDFSVNTEFALVALNIDGNTLGGMALLVLGRGTGKIKDLIGSMPNTNYEATYVSATNKWTITNKSGSNVFVTAMITKGLLT